MTADEFRTAMRVLDEGRPTYNIYEIEDAAAAIAPVKRAYWRAYASVVLVAIAPISAIVAVTHAPTWILMPVALLSPGWLISALRDRLIPVHGLGSDEILRAAMK